MTVAIEPEVEAFIKKLPVARLATADAEGRPSVVPVCFVLVDGYFYTPIDEKRKSVSWGRLKRLRNIEVNPAVSLVIDHYEADWTALGYVLVRGVAETIAPRGRYAKEHATAHRETPLPIPTVQKRPHRPETADQNQPRNGHALDCHYASSAGVGFSLQLSGRRIGLGARFRVDPWELMVRRQSISEIWPANCFCQQSGKSAD